MFQFDHRMRLALPSDAQKLFSKVNVVPIAAGNDALLHSENTFVATMKQRFKTKQKYSERKCNKYLFPRASSRQQHPIDFRHTNPVCPTSQTEICQPQGVQTHDGMPHEWTMLPGIMNQQIEWAVSLAF